MQIQDTTGRLSALDRDMLQNISTPLDVKILFTSEDSRPGLEIHVHNMVTSANTLAIGVDPVHHYAFTHFGTGTGIRKADYDGIERAGNAEFHAGHWGAGARAIVNAADAASSQTQRSEVVIQQPTTVVEHSASPWPFVVGFGLLAVAVLLVWRWMRRRATSIENAAQEARDEAQEMRTRNIEEQGWHDKFAQKVGTSTVPAPNPGQAPAVITAREVLAIPAASGYVPQPYVQPMVAPVIVGSQSVYGGGNDLLTGMLIGEALERPREVVREVVREEPVHSRSDDSWGSSSSDSGGGGSSWDSGGSSDSGGGGGGFDSGGSDGGGGGGDF